MPNLADAAEHYSRALGLGSASDAVEDPVQQVRVAFASLDNGGVVEFVEPLGEHSPLHGVLARGSGLYHAGYEVPDIRAAIEQVQSAGGRLVSGPVPARAFGDRLIAFVYTRTRDLIEFWQR